MLKFLWQRSLRFLIGALLLILFIAGIFPGTGGEGAQREFQNLSQKTDWWNFATAGLYGSWPNFFGSWEFSLTVVQMFIYLLGIYLISRELTLKQNRFFFIIISTTGALFVIQLWRDATLFSLLTLSLGLLASLKKLQTPKEYLRLFFALSICLSGFLFKPIFAPLGILVIMVFLSLSLPTKRRMASFTLAALLISFIPFFFDKQLSSHFQLTKSYPEQQVMIYDLSKMYCWGYSQEAISQSKDALKALLRNEDGYEKVCASLSPTGWDSIRVINPEVRSSPAL